MRQIIYCSDRRQNFDVVLRNVQTRRDDDNNRYSIKQVNSFVVE